eukprot:CAMPEP_0198133002 /NCGR_PEP_ID=MMETSP1442-20131203/59338_1 /TAXON_ID= /ORGANISM="Craspedostauros australis, Strain CCMP3328" /LENGTH=304 /DNA_ID=CAMNT_0043794105 /DNA_START=525 /DNA_END=1439 /DNA_ORIENTATION=-
MASFVSRSRPMAMSAVRLVHRANLRTVSQLEPLLLRTCGGSSFHQSQQPLFGHLRHFSATPPPQPDDKPKDDKGMTGVRGILSQIVTPQNQFYALVAGGGVVTYIVSRIFLGFTSFFTHLNPAVVVKYGFYTGFGTATLLGGLVCVAADNLYIRADPVFKYCLSWVQRDSKVKEALGDGLVAGSLRSYRLDSGKIEMEGVTPKWKPPRIQMLFDIEARGPPYRTGLVTCEAIKQEGFPPRLHTTLLKVDYETGNEGEGGSVEGDETVFLRGDESNLSRVSGRSGLSLDMLGRQVHINKAASEGK